MGNREENVYDDDSGYDRKEREEQPKKRLFNGITKFFDSRSKRTVVVEYTPDTTPELNYVGELCAGYREGSLDVASSICREASVRARILVGGQYIGHIYEDGSYDNAVARLFA